MAAIAAIAATPDGLGYWLVGRDGQVYTFGDATFYGPQRPLAGPITAMSPTADGHGYWLVAGNGAVNGFGDAVARRSPTGLGSVVGIAVDARTGGYWLANSRGQVYAFGAPFFGSVPSVASEHGVTGIQAAPGGSGYRLVDSGGALFCFGTVTELGTANSVHPDRAVVGISAP